MTKNAFKKSHVQAISTVCGLDSAAQLQFQNRLLEYGKAAVGRNPGDGRLSPKEARAATPVAEMLTPMGKTQLNQIDSTLNQIDTKARGKEFTLVGYSVGSLLLGLTAVMAMIPLAWENVEFPSLKVEPGIIKDSAIYITAGASIFTGLMIMAASQYFYGTAARARKLKSAFSDILNAVGREIPRAS